MYTLHGHTGSVLDCRFDPKGDFMASVGSDEIVMVWRSNFDKAAGGSWDRPPSELRAAVPDTPAVPASSRSSRKALDTGRGHRASAGGGAAEPSPALAPELAAKNVATLQRRRATPPASPASTGTAAARARVSALPPPPLPLPVATAASKDTRSRSVSAGRARGGGPATGAAAGSGARPPAADDDVVPWSVEDGSDRRVASSSGWSSRAVPGDGGGVVLTHDAPWDTADAVAPAQPLSTGVPEEIAGSLKHILSQVSADSCRACCARANVVVRIDPDDALPHVCSCDRQMNVLMQTMSLLDARLTRNERQMQEMRTLLVAAPSAPATASMATSAAAASASAASSVAHATPPRMDA